MSKAAFDLVIVGVGGQGTLLASKILGRLALSENCGVKVSEVHGMSQRGGSVITHVRVGDSVHSPMVALGGADYLISFEALEAARATCYLKPGGTVIVNTQRIFAHARYHRRDRLSRRSAGVPRALPRRERRRAGHRRGVRQPKGAEPGAARHVQPASALLRRPGGTPLRLCASQNFEVNLAAFERGRALMGDIQPL